MDRNRLESICELFTKVIKYDPIRPITDLVEMYSENGVIHIGSTDGTIRIVTTMECEADIPNTVICLSNFTKILKLSTKDEIKLSNKGSYLSLVCNGRYKIPIQLDESGNNISLPLSMPKYEGITYDVAPFKQAVNRLTLSLYTGEANPMLNRYANLEDRFIATDGMILGVSYGKAVAEQMYPTIANTISYLPSKTFTYAELSGGHRITTDDGIEIFIKLGVPNDYPLHVLGQYLDLNSFNNPVEISKKQFIECLKRLDIYRDKLEEVPSILLEVKEGKLIITDSREQCVEDIDVNPDVIQPIMKFGTEYITRVIRKMEETITLKFNDRALCLIDDKGFYVIAKMARKEE